MRRDPVDRMSTRSRRRCSCGSIRRCRGCRQAVQLRLRALAGRRVTEQGEVLFTAQRFRTQERNRQARAGYADPVDRARGGTARATHRNTADSRLEAPAPADQGAPCAHQADTGVRRRPTSDSLRTVPRAEKLWHAVRWSVRRGTAMLRDAHGLEVTAASAAAVQAFDHALIGYLGYRADTPQRMAAVFASRSGVRPGTLPEGLFRHAGLQAVAGADRRGRGRGRGTPHRAGDAARARACRRAAALDRWRAGSRRGHLGTDPRRASARHPGLPPGAFRQLLARAAGCNAGIGASASSATGATTLPGYNAILGCRCFAHEECGHYTEAEAAGRAAIDRDPGDLWAAHGVAHVLEMQGRRSEGIAWIDSLRGNWEEANNLRHHLWWHAAMFHMERRRDRIACWRCTMANSAI